MCEHDIDIFAKCNTWWLDRRIKIKSGIVNVPNSYSPEEKIICTRNFRLSAWSMNPLFSAYKVKFFCFLLNIEWYMDAEY